MNINDLFNQSKDAEDTGFGDLLGPKQLPSGTEVLCEIVWSQAGTTKKGGKQFKNKFKVLEGDHEGGEFFDNLYFSPGTDDGQLSYNKRLFGKLQGAGLGAQYFSQEPSDEAIATALVGNKVRVKIQWQALTAEQKAKEEAGEPQTPFLNNTTTWSPADGAGGGSYVPGSSAPKGF